MLTNRPGKHELEYTASAICDNYCKFPLIWDEDRFGELSESDVCKNCPLNQLVEGLALDDRIRSYI